MKRLIVCNFCKSLYYFYACHCWNSTLGVNFINILSTNFLYLSALSSFSLVTLWLWNFLAQKVQVKCSWNWHQVSILPVLYKHLFQAKAFYEAFLYSQFGFVIFWWEGIGAKATRKMLVKLTYMVARSKIILIPSN